MNILRDILTCHLIKMDNKMDKEIVYSNKVLNKRTIIMLKTISLSVKNNRQGKTY